MIRAIALGLPPGACCAGLARTSAPEIGGTDRSCGVA
jgi:hypothetical protein